MSENRITREILKLHEQTGEWVRAEQLDKYSNYMNKLVSESGLGLGLWCLMPLSTISKLHCEGGNRSTKRKPPICRTSLTNFITKCCIEYTSSWTGFELTTLVVIGTDCTGSCKSNYHAITTTVAPVNGSMLINSYTWIYIIVYAYC